MDKINERIEDLETLHRLQTQNAQHYYWNRNDEYHGEYWKEQAKATKEKIDKLKQEREILKKWIS